MEVWQEIASDSSAGALRLVNEYGDRLFTAAFLLCQNATDAEDLVYRTFERVIDKIGDYHAESAFFSWMYSILLNFRKSDLRRKGYNSLVFKAELPDDEEDIRPSPSEVLAAKSDAEEIDVALAKLPERLRAVIVLRFYADASMEEMAQMLGIPVGTVKFRLHHAKRELVRLLAGKLSFLIGRHTL